MIRNILDLRSNLVTPSFDGLPKHYLELRAKGCKLNLIIFVSLINILNFIAVLRKNEL
jgi:hypothetical protein